MNILVVCHYGLYQDLTASFVHNQVKAYAALGHQVRVIIPIAIGKRNWDGKRFSAPLQRQEKDGVKLFLLRYLSLSKYGEKRFNTAAAIHSFRANLDAILDGFASDIIHAHTLGFDSGIGAWLKERLGVPLVVTSHGSDASVPVEQGRGAELKPACGHADAVVAVSSALAGKIRTCGTSTPISVILNGFDLQALPEANGERGCAFIQVGSLQEQKRVHVTIRAFASLRERHPDTVLDIVGSGSEMERFQALCGELGVSESVHFHGFLPNPETLAKMAKSQFFVMPSVNEGFGIVYLEAMACGCITIGTEGEGIADLIVSGENGFLVPPDDPNAIVRVIEWCLEHPEESAAIAERGRKDAMGLTWEKNASEYIKFFKELQHGTNDTK